MSEDTSGEIETLDDLDSIPDEVEGGDDGNTPASESEDGLEDGGEKDEGQDEKEEETTTQEAEPSGSTESPADKQSSDSDSDRPSDKGGSTDDDGTVIRVKNGEDFVELSETATMRVPVNGRNELVTLQELKENYSGEVGYAEQFEKFQEQKTKHEEEVTLLQSEMEKIGGLLRGDSPLDAALYLAQIGGGDPIDTRAKILQSLSEDLAAMSDLSDAERELKILKDGQATADRLYELQHRQRQETGGQDLGQLLSVANVSQEDYNNALKVYQAEGKEAKTEEVIAYARLTPYFDPAMELLEPYEENFSDSEMAEFTGVLAQKLYESGGREPDVVFQETARELGYELDNEGGGETPPTEKTPPVVDKKETVKIPETFDELLN